MHDKEKKDFYLQTCHCCLLAEAMKDCASCRFNIGMQQQTAPVNTNSSKGILTDVFSLEKNIGAATSMQMVAGSPSR